MGWAVTPEPFPPLLPHLLALGSLPNSLTVLYLPIFPDQASSPIEMESDYLRYD